MALTPEKQADLDFQTALNAMLMQGMLTTQTRQSKLEAIRLAKETLIENARSKPVDSREVTAADITAFADALVASVNA